MVTKADKICESFQNYVLFYSVRMHYLYFRNKPLCRDSGGVYSKRGDASYPSDPRTSCSPRYETIIRLTYSTRD